MVTFILRTPLSQQPTQTQKAFVESRELIQSDMEDILALTPQPGGDTTTVTPTEVVRTIVLDEILTPEGSLFRLRFPSEQNRQEAVTGYLLMRAQATFLRSKVEQEAIVDPP